MADCSQLILSLTLQGVCEGDIINFLQTLGVSRENLATSSIIQIVNHGISFGDSVNDESMTGNYRYLFGNVLPFKEFILRQQLICIMCAHGKFRLNFEFHATFC